MRLTEKSQVTIPKAIREKLGIGPGSEVEFVDEGTFVRLVPRSDDESPVERKRRLEAHLDGLAGQLDLGPRSVDEFMAEIRGERDDLDPR